MLAPSHASRNRTVPGWQQWLFLETGRYEVGRDGCPPHRMLLGTGRYQVGRDGCSPYRMLLDVTRLAAMDAGRDGCSPHRMLLGTGRYQVGRDGCWQGRMLAPSDASTSIATEKDVHSSTRASLLALAQLSDGRASSLDFSARCPYGTGRMKQQLHDSSGD